MQGFLTAIFGMFAPFIVGGTPIQPGDPIGAMTVYLQLYSGACSAVVIDENLVLTAAHCLDQSEPSTLSVGFLAGNNMIYRPVTQFRYPSQYVPVTTNYIKDDYDIGMVQFSGGLPPGFTTAQQGLPEGQALSNGETVTVAGFGQEQEGKAPDITLNKVDLTIADPQISNMEIQIHQTSTQGACYGDSGGPAFVSVQGSLYLVGVASHYWQDPHCSSDILYTSVGAFKDWISQTAAGLNKS